MTTQQHPEATAAVQHDSQLVRYDSKAKAADLTRIDSLGAANFVNNDPEEKERDQVAGNETAFVGLTKWQAIRRFWRASMFCYFCSFGVMMDGYQVSLPGGVLANRGFIDQFGTVTSPTTGLPALNAKHVSAFSGTAYVGQFTGTFIGGFISDRFGRRIAMWAMTFFLAMGVVIEMVSRSWQHWLVGKIVTGIGQGLIQQCMLTYISEIAPAQIRGTLLCSYGWGFSIGQLLSSVALQIVNKTDPTNYLKAIYSEWVPLGLWMILLVFMPESPWFYARRGNDDKAVKTLKHIHKGVEGYDAGREYAVMVNEIEHEKELKALQSTTSWFDLFKDSHRKRTLGGIFCLAMQNWAGSSVVFNFTAFFFQQAGLPEPFQASVIVYCILIFSIMVAFYAIERLGRRTLVLSAGVACGIFNILIGSMGLLTQTTSVQNATLAIICMWVFSYACGFAGTGWTMAGEVATPRLRAKTAGFVAATNAISGAIFNSTVPLMISNSGAGAQGWGVRTLFMFAILVAVGTVINFFLLPETKGRTFNELDEMYEKRIAPRKMKAYISSVEAAGIKQH